MLCLYLEAPFAVCRTFTAGWYRPSATFLTPSAAYGLVLNVAGIESRLREGEEGHDGRTPASLVRPGLPALRVALGVPALPGKSFQEQAPRVQTIYQQLHNYPVGRDAGIPEEMAKGNKNNITPVRREFLSGVRAVICLDGNGEFEARVRAGLAGRLNAGRYGLPFLGDNQFLPDRLEEIPWPLTDGRFGFDRVYWYERLTDDPGRGPRPHTTRLTVRIDRADLSRTVSNLYAPTSDPSPEPPTLAWTDLP